MQIARVPLRKINEALRITLPLKLTRELGLRAGDYVDLVQDSDDVRLRFVKVEPPMEAAE
jgi:bifunctional DNA-binding transcriptional regulator/antitoxin component of YhaV-PrlF toxin-antitoxin module